VLNLTVSWGAKEAVMDRLSERGSFVWVPLTVGASVIVFLVAQATPGARFLAEGLLAGVLLLAG
jgi:hypothetical protein